jgi:tetratricopeptide (TPR) repeat protein
MKRMTIAAIAWIAVPLALASQEKPAPQKPSVDKAAEMTEDVEILRHLLNKSVGLEIPNDRTSGTSTFHGISEIATTATILQTDLHGTEGRSYLFYSAYPQFDGVYLNRHGIAYTVRLSNLEQTVYARHERTGGLEATCLQCHQVDNVAKFQLQPAAAGSKPLTDWDKARDELRGLGGDASKPSAKNSNLALMCRPGNLTESIVKLLAANGRNLRHLAPDENVSVVVTYDGLKASASDRYLSSLADPTLWIPANRDMDPSGKFGLTPDESKQLALGDLHLKQGKGADAVKAFETALSRYTTKTNRLAWPRNAKRSDLDAAIKDLQASLRSAYRSLAQAYIGAGRLDDAKQALEMAQHLVVQFDDDAKPKGMPVPAKIVLSVKKSHLDKADSLSPAEFRKGFAIELVGVSALKK